MKMRCANGALLFWTVQVLAFAFLRTQPVLSQSSTESWVTEGMTHHRFPSNKRIDPSEDDAPPSSPVTSLKTDPPFKTVQATTAIDDRGIPLHEQNLLQMTTGMSTSSERESVSPSLMTSSVENETSEKAWAIPSTEDTVSSDAPETSVSERVGSVSTPLTVAYSNASSAKDVKTGDITRTTKAYFWSTEPNSPTDKEPEKVSKSVTENVPTDPSTIVGSVPSFPLVQTTSARNASEAPADTRPDVSNAGSEETSPILLEMSSSLASAEEETSSSPVARPLVQTASTDDTPNESTASLGAVTAASKPEETTATKEENNLLPELDTRTTSHSTRPRGNTFPSVSEIWSEPTTRRRFTSFFTSNDMTNNLFRSSGLTHSTSLDESPTTSSEQLMSPELLDTPEDDTTLLTYDATTTDRDVFESEEPEEVFVSAKTNATQPPPTTVATKPPPPPPPPPSTTTTTTTTTMTTTSEKPSTAPPPPPPPPKVNLTTTEQSETVETTTELSTTMPTSTASMQTSSVTASTELPVINITETVLPITLDENVTTTEAVATTQKELEPYKYHGHLTLEENNNAVTVIFHTPPDQKMDVFWSIDRNRKFRIAVAHIINMETNKAWGHKDSNEANADDVQMDQPMTRLATWPSPDDLVYISPSPVAENRSIYVAFFIRNSSAGGYAIVSADLIVNALTANKPYLEEEMGLNVTQITKGIILVKVVQPFFVRHAIIIISLLGVAVFCIVIIIIALICIRCRSSRRWNRSEYDDKNKLKRDMKQNRDIGDLNSDQDIQNDEPQVKGGYPYLNGNGMHPLSLAEEGWVIPLEQPPPLHPKPHHAEVEDTKL